MLCVSKIIRIIGRSIACYLIATFFLSMSLYAKENDLKSIIKYTINTNPEVQVTWRQLLVGGLDVKAAQAGWRPTLDFDASSSYVDRNYGSEEDYLLNSAEITLSQLLYDGFLTSSEVKQLKQAQVVYFYEFYGQAEQTALETSLAYFDVLQYRALLKISEENLKTHISVFKQIEESAQAGVAKGADLEQISGRLSLSETNVITEQSNLHDVSARFLRVTGLEPPLNMSNIKVNVENEIKSSVTEEIKSAYLTNPSLLASVYNIDANQYSVQSARSEFHPQLSLNASYSVDDRDDSGLDNTINEGIIGLQFTYNLYNGGRSSAALTSALEQVNIAKDLREKACRDMRQTIQIAYNDIENINRQIPSLNEYKLSSSRVRTAYLDQFKLGQRTLLDLLDSENEAYEASRNHTIAIFGQEKAFFRLLASKGELLNYLQIMREDIPTPEEIAAKPIVYDPEYICPALSVNDLNEGGNILTRDSDKDGIIDVWDNCPNTKKDSLVDGYGCPEKNEFEVVETLTLSVQFKNNSAVLEDSMRLTLAPIVAKLKSNPNQGIIIEGHASLQGAAIYNKNLSEQRAKSVANWIVDHGIGREKVFAIGYGEEQPIIDAINEKANAVNRRIEARIILLNNVKRK